jgi:hypothetical protein
MEIAGAAIQLARRTPGPSAHRRLLRWLRMSQRVSQGHERNRCTHHEKSHFHIPTLPCSRPARRFHNTIAPAPANKLIPPGNTRCMSWARNARPALEWRVRRSPDTGHGSGALDVRFLPIVLQKSKVAGPRFFRENTKREVIADSYNLNRVTEVACEFYARR